MSSYLDKSIKDHLLLMIILTAEFYFADILSHALVLLLQSFFIGFPQHQKF